MADCNDIQYSVKIFNHSGTLLQEEHGVQGNSVVQLGNSLEVGMFIMYILDRKRPMDSKLPEKAKR